MRTILKSFKVLFILILIIGINQNSLLGQMKMKSGDQVIDHQVNEGDSVFLEIQEYRGTLQWQTSTDGETWTNLEGQTANMMHFTADAENYVRVAVSAEYCDPVYSQTVHVVVTMAQEGTFMDERDSKEYKWVLIGSQKWMAENLAWLPEVSPPSEGSATEIFYYVQGYDGTNTTEAIATDNYGKFGALYNWNAAKNACPDGWHLPTDIEWKILETYLGMSETDINDQGWRESGSVGGKLKESGTEHWKEPNAGADNSTGFTALPGGGRSNGQFDNLDFAFFFTSSERGENDIDRNLGFHSGAIGRWISPAKAAGFSVRCIKNSAVENTPPTATFTFDPSVGTTDTRFVFDASACTDAETAAEFLEIRWDFDGDGNWDSEFDQAKFIVHQYETPGTYTVKMVVIDELEFSTEFTKTITIN